MLRALLLTVCLLVFTGCVDENPTHNAYELPSAVFESEAPNKFRPVEYPMVNIPRPLRQRNWTGSKGEGSCCHASLITLLRWQGQFNTAQRWKQTYGDGEYPWTFAHKLTSEGIPFAQTRGKNDVNFLEWACQTRRGACVVVLQGEHMISLIHFDESYACLIDNRFPENTRWVERQSFLDHWQQSGSWAITPIYTPPAPLVAQTKS